MVDAAPAVSVVIATYNRSNVLRFAVESVRWQTWQDWELHIVGDACTDDTADVVASFDDPRIWFTNLESNTGDQSAPNNEGVRRSTGRYVAFLNHDDLWFPDHLECAVAALESSGADMVFTLGAALSWSGRTMLTGIAPGHRYSLLTFAPASTWLAQRALIDRVGPWLPPSASREVPSQHWLARAHALGADMHSVRELTVALIASTARPGSYRDRLVEDHRRLADRLRDDPEATRCSLLRQIAVEHAVEALPQRALANLRRLARDIVRRTSVRAGIHPDAASSALRLERRGGWLNRVYERRGLPSPRGGDDARGT